MKRFSQRIGKTPIKDVIQIEFIDDSLLNKLWNAVTTSYWRAIDTHSKDMILQRVWTNFFNGLLDEMPQYSYDTIEAIKNFVFQRAEWYEIYDFIEFLPNSGIFGDSNLVNDNFIELCNQIFEKELSGYRFVNNLITPIISEIEIESIEEALSIDDKYRAVKEHLNRALELFSDRHNPDYRNSIKESISAIEAYCRILTGNPKATLGDALNEIERNHNLHRALKSSFSSLYGYTSDEGGIRHSLLEESNLKQEDAIFMLVTCSAFVNYLEGKR